MLFNRADRSTFEWGGASLCAHAGAARARRSWQSHARPSKSGWTASQTLVGRQRRAGGRKPLHLKKFRARLLPSLTAPNSPPPPVAGAGVAVPPKENAMVVVCFCVFVLFASQADGRAAISAVERAVAARRLSPKTIETSCFLSLFSLSSHATYLGLFPHLVPRHPDGRRHKRFDVAKRCLPSTPPLELERRKETQHGSRARCCPPPPGASIRPQPGDRRPASETRGGSAQWKNKGKMKEEEGGCVGIRAAPAAVRTSTRAALVFFSSLERRRCRQRRARQTQFFFHLAPRTRGRLSRARGDNTHQTQSLRPHPHRPRPPPAAIFLFAEDKPSSSSPSFPPPQPHTALATV